jgi:hypothetical protein
MYFVSLPSTANASSFHHYWPRLHPTTLFATTPHVPPPLLYGSLISFPATLILPMKTPRSNCGYGFHQAYFVGFQTPRWCSSSTTLIFPPTVLLSLLFSSLLVAAVSAFSGSFASKLPLQTAILGGVILCAKSRMCRSHSFGLFPIIFRFFLHYSGILCLLLGYPTHLLYCFI